MTAVAEKAGKHVDLLVVPGTNVFEAASDRGTARLRDIWAGISAVMAPAEQAKRMGEAWESLPEKPAHPLRYRIVDSGKEVHDYLLGARPALTDADISFSTASGST